MYICLSLPITAAAEAIPLEEVNEPVTIIVNTIPEDDDACTDVVPAPEVEGACVLASASQQDECEHIKHAALADLQRTTTCMQCRVSVMCVSVYLPLIAHHSSR